MALRPTTLTLYHRPFSNCSARVRIAARLKGVELILKNATPYFQNGSLEDKDAQRFHIEINPNGKVPALVADYANGQRQTLTQSLTILQLLEETYPNTTRLIPPVTDMSARLKVQDLALTIACDIQPLPTARVCSTLSYMGFDPKVLTPEQWARQRIIYGMKKYEAMVKHSVGKYSEIGLPSSTARLRAHRERITAKCETLEAFRLEGLPYGGFPRNDYDFSAEKRRIVKRKKTNKQPAIMQKRSRFGVPESSDA